MAPVKISCVLSFSSQEIQGGEATEEPPVEAGRSCLEPSPPQPLCLDGAVESTEPEPGPETQSWHEHPAGSPGAAGQGCGRSCSARPLPAESAPHTPPSVEKNLLWPGLADPLMPGCPAPFASFGIALWRGRNGAVSLSRRSRHKAETTSSLSWQLFIIEHG